MTWVNGVRRVARVQLVREDPLLSRTAALWAARCAEAGLISHRGDDGSTALDRYRSLGGTEVSIGEILGAGPDVARVEKGWMASDEHRRLALAPGWTHAGWGSAQSGTSQVTVMLFTRKLVERLVITGGPGGLVVTGAYLPRDAARGALYDGLDEVAPSTWEPDGRAFRFDLPAVLIARYIRLGYVTPDGRFTLTNAFTWPPGTESPGGPGRFAPPAPSP
jgi:Cysteine-rich secretory protein family